MKLRDLRTSDREVSGGTAHYQPLPEPPRKLIVHVMTIIQVFSSGAVVYQCSTCAHREVIGPDGQRVVTVSGVESAAHGIAQLPDFPAGVAK